MAKKHTLFECQHCGFESSKWLGKCTNCGAWESFVELSATQIQALKTIQNAKYTPTAKATPITDVAFQTLQTFTSYEEELDIVLGGGIVSGGLYLVGGSPGVGKSTLLLKISGSISQNTHNKVLYVSGEESPSKITHRA